LISSNLLLQNFNDVMGEFLLDAIYNF